MSKIKHEGRDGNEDLSPPSPDLSPQSQVLSPPSPVLSPAPRQLVIAIDGPSGSGKSTLGKAVARQLGYLYIDSGAVYRAVGWKALSTNTQLDDLASIARLAREARIKLEGDPDHLRVILDGRDVTSEIRLPEASHASSVVATIPEVRDAVVEALREMSQDGGVVMDGRDIGTKVFPDAHVKLFLDASLDERARRRAEEERARGRTVTIEQTRSEMEERDRRDRERAATPLVIAEDAILIDTSNTPLEVVIERVLEIVRARS
jgi:cytidylate kinase